VFFEFLSRISGWANFAISFGGGLHIFLSILVEKLAGCKEIYYLCGRKRWVMHGITGNAIESELKIVD